MKQQIKLTESELFSIIKESVKNLVLEFGRDKKNRDKMAKAAKRGIKKGDASTYNNAVNSLAKAGASKDEMNDFHKSFEKDLDENKVIKEFTNFDKEKTYGKPSNDEEEIEGFNEQPSNVAVEGKKPIKVTESELKSIIKESVKSILKEIGDKHRFGQGKYGLAMDAASKAKSLGRFQQADNLKSYGADAFNDEYGTQDFQMDEYGQLRHKGIDGKERMYRPNSIIKSLEAQKGLQDGEKRLDNAIRNNGFIKNAAQTAKAFPRKKMTGGLNAIDTVDSGIHENM